MIVFAARITQGCHLHTGFLSRCVLLLLHYYYYYYYYDYYFFFYYYYYYYYYKHKARVLKYS